MGGARRNELERLFRSGTLHYVRDHGRCVKINDGDFWMTYSVLLWKLFYPEDPILPNECIHHIDWNPWNNEVTNLMKMDKKQHALLHQPGRNIRNFIWADDISRRHRHMGDGRFILTHRANRAYHMFKPMTW